jgi:hypothetical protein
VDSVIYYEDIEKELVAFFLTKFDSGSVLVATKTPQPDETDVPANWLIVNVTPGRTKTPVTRYYAVVLEIYAEDYSTASSLSLQADFWLRNATATRSIKNVDVLVGPVRLGEEGLKEKRSISAELVVKAWTD